MPPFVAWWGGAGGSMVQRYLCLAVGAVVAALKLRCSDGRLCMAGGWRVVVR